MKEFFTNLFKKKSSKRIWELDAFRGVCIICMVVIHAIFDIREFFGISFDMPVWFDYIQKYGGILFIVISGICVTLGHHNILRGTVVAFCASVITLVTMLTVGKDLWILFGILHLLAFCMITYSLYRKLPWGLILVIGIAVIAVGFWFKTFYVRPGFLFPLGLRSSTFTAGDYFPIFPNLGYFMIGVVLGKTVYKNKETLFKKANDRNAIIRFLSFCGRHSLLIYMIHQPVILGAAYAVRFLGNLIGKIREP